MLTSKLGVQLASKAVGCNVCFETLPLRRARISLPQPFAVGKHYRKGGVALVGINPGASMDGDYKEVRRVALERFAGGDSSALTSYWESLAADAENTWNPKYLARVQSLGLQIDQLLIGNLALCATAENEYPKRMLRNCWVRHTESSITRFAPDTLVLMGADATVGEFLRRVRSSLPSLRAIRIAHYAHRKGTAYEKAECERVRAFLRG